MDQTFEKQFNNYDLLLALNLSLTGNWQSVKNPIHDVYWNSHKHKENRPWEFLLIDVWNLTRLLPEVFLKDALNPHKTKKLTHEEMMIKDLFKEFKKRQVS